MKRNAGSAGIPGSIPDVVVANERRDWLDQLVTIEGAAQTLACTPAAVRKWLSQGRLARVKVGRLTRIRTADVADIVAHGLPERRSSIRSAQRKIVSRAYQNVLA